MARDAALGMNWLHTSHPPIIHRDLKVIRISPSSFLLLSLLLLIHFQKASNLLVDEHLSVKLSDFGLSQVKQTPHLIDGKEGARGTPLWMAPEVLMCRPFDEKADVYSFGLVLWEILTRLEPYAHYRNFRIFREDVCMVRTPVSLLSHSPHPFFFTSSHFSPSFSNTHTPETHQTNNPPQHQHHTPQPHHTVLGK
jgi:serine/threonine protein kinase